VESRYRQLMTCDGGNGWEEWRKHVLAEMARTNDWMASVEKRLQAARMEIAALKVKATGWGALGGCIVAAGTLGIALAVSLLKG